MKILKRTRADIALWGTPASIVEIEERLERYGTAN